MTFRPGQVLTDARLNANEIIGKLVFFAARTSAQSLTNVTTTDITLDTPSIDTLGAYSAGAPTRFTPTLAGYYTFGGRVGFAANATGQRIAGLGKNGTDVSWTLLNTTAADAPAVPLPPGYPIYMNGTTDYVTLRAYQSSGGALNTSTTAAIIPFITATYVSAG